MKPNEMKSLNKNPDPIFRGRRDKVNVEEGIEIFTKNLLNL